MSRDIASIVIPERVFGGLTTCYQDSVSFSELRITYVEELSTVLAEVARNNRDSELMSFSRYLKHLRSKLHYYSIPNFLRKGIGLVIHITPNNVPLGFAYSFIWGFLSGNSNIVKTPIQNKEQTDLFFSCLDIVNQNPQFGVFTEQNIFTNISSSDTRFKGIIEVCDAKVIWGSNTTIESIASIQKSVYTKSITFPDRVSVSVISLTKYRNLSLDARKSLAKKFVRDFQSFNQLACSSPWILYWLGATDSHHDVGLTQEFWRSVCDELDSIPSLLSGLGSLRMAKLAKISAQKTVNFKTVRNLKYLTLLDIENVAISEIDAGYGIFYQKNSTSVKDILLDLNERVQTLTYFGIELKDLEEAIKLSTSSVPKRLVPIGTALDFEWIWDGKDAMSELTEICQLL